MAEHGESAERLPSNVSMVKDKHLPGAEYRIIYSPHSPRTAITRDELGDRKKMQVFCIELVNRKHEKMHVDPIEAAEALKFLEPAQKEPGSVWMSDALHVARLAKSRIFYTDMFLPATFVDDEFEEMQDRLDADKKAIQLIAVAGIVAAALSGKLEQWIDGFFKSKVVSRRWLLGGIGAVSGVVALKSSPLIIQDLVMPDSEETADKISASPIKRTLLRGGRRMEEAFGTPTMLGTAILRNLCIAFKVRAATRLFSEDNPGTANIRAVLPLGDMHFGVEDALTLPDAQLVDAMEKLADRLNLGAESRKSMYSLAEVKTPARRIASATIHNLKK